MSPALHTTKMKQRFTLFIIISVIITGLAASDIYLFQKLRDNEYAQTEVVYSQTGSPQAKLIELIEQSRKYVYFAIYTFTKEEIADALIAAKLRGLEVKGVIDFNQTLTPEEKTIIKKLKKYDIEPRMMFKDKGLMHIKMVITDIGYASGSYNWTNSAATVNDEVLEIGRVKNIQDQYVQIFNVLYQRYAP